MPTGHIFKPFADTNLNCYDRSRGGNHLTTVNNVTRTQVKRGVHVGEFDGSSSYIEGTSLSLPIIKDLTMIVWVKLLADYSSGTQPFLVVAESINNTAALQKDTSDDWRAIFIGGGTVELASYDDSSLASKWTQLMLLKDGSDLSFGVNGSIKDTRSSAVDMDAAASTIYIGYNETEYGECQIDLDTILVADYAMDIDTEVKPYFTATRRRFA